MKPRPIRLLPELKPFIEQSLESKVLFTQGIVAHNLLLMKDKCAVAFSGGKDSLLVLYFVWNLVPDIPVVFNNTGVEYPETVQFVHSLAERWHLNLIETKPERTFWDCVDLWGFPVGKRPKKGKPSSRKCCYWLKDKPMLLALRKLGCEGYFTGMTAVENRTRMFTARDKGTCYVTEGFRKVHPILYWTPDDVWNYLKEKQIEANPVYQMGADRVGCSTCTAFLDWEKQLSTVNHHLYQLVKQKMVDRENISE